MRRILSSTVGAVVEARSELRVHRTRVLLSLIGVAVAIAALTSVVGLGQMARQSTTESFERGGGRAATLVVSAYSQSGAALNSSALGDAVATASERYGISHVTPAGYSSQRIQFPDGVADVQTQLVGVDYRTMHRLAVLDGSWFTESDADRLAPGLVVNEAFWQRIGSPDLRTHPTVTIVGASEATAVILGVTSSYPGDPTLSAMMLLASYERIADPAQLASVSPGYEFWVPGDLADSIMAGLTSDLRGVLGSAATVDVFRSDYAANGEDPLGPITLVITGVAVLILFLGALSLVNISLVTVRQRVREIGIRRSFGATSGRVFFAVMMESVVGTVAAGVIGVFVAVLVVTNPTVQQLVAQGAIELPPFPLEAALVGLGAATAVGALAGLLPALVAVRVRVIDAIRY
ncbi:MAG: ABC transporter permease [Microbacteriaceae bacterium]|nr:ABC transporter permease [Microbacteriaceae bacterium]